MHETSDDIQWLQSVLTRSIEGAGPFLRSSFRMPEHSLRAEQVVASLQGSVVVALATVTARGEPRVAPIGALFYRGRFHVPTITTAARTRHVQKRPAVSLSYFEGITLAVLVHGQATLLLPDDPEFVALEALQEASGGSSPRTWGEGLFLRIEPDTMYTYAEEPEQVGSMTHNE